MLLLVVVGCSDSNDPRTTEPLTAAQASLVADVVTVDADEIIEAGGINMSTGLALAPPAEAPPMDCQPVITPFPPTNSDEDFVPDSVRFAFANCSFTRGATTHTISRGASRSGGE